MYHEHYASIFVTFWKAEYFNGENGGFSWNISVDGKQKHGVRAYRSEYMTVYQDEISIPVSYLLDDVLPLQLDEIKTLTEPFK